MTDTTASSPTQVLMKAAAMAESVSRRLSSLPERMELTDPLAMVRAFPEVAVCVQMLAEAVSASLQELGIGRLTWEMVGMPEGEATQYAREAMRGSGEAPATPGKGEGP